MNNFIFFGTDDFSIEVLNTLLEKGFKPSFCITQPDRPKGRSLVLTAPEIKLFCQKNNIEVLQPEDLSKDVILGPNLSGRQVEPAFQNIDYFVVASYGRIIPKEIVELPRLGTLNVHPSLLPKHRGASPIETVILNNEKETGVTIILMDEKMDHGPIIEQRKVSFETWPNKMEMRKQMAKIGGEMLIEIIPKMISGEMKTVEQNNNDATFTKMLKKADGEINLEDDPEKNYLKYIALNPWPGTFFFIKKDNRDMRVKIKEAVLENNKFVIKKVIPEGKSEMTFESFENGYNHKN